MQIDMQPTGAGAAGGSGGMGEWLGRELVKRRRFYSVVNLTVVALSLIAAMLLVATGRGEGARQAEVAAVAERAAAQAAGAASQTEALSREVEETKEVAAQVQTGLAEVTEDVASAAASPAAMEALSEQTAAAVERVEALEEIFAQARPFTGPDLAGRLAGIESALADQRADTGRLLAGIDELSARITSLENRTASLENTVGAHGVSLDSIHGSGLRYVILRERTTQRIEGLGVELQVGPAAKKGELTGVEVGLARMADGRRLIRHGEGEGWVPLGVRAEFDDAGNGCRYGVLPRRLTRIPAVKDYLEVLVVQACPRPRT